MWTSDKSVAFADQMNINEISNIRSSLADNNTDVNCIMEKIQNLFESTANAVLGPEREYQINSNAKRKPIKFGRETLNKRNKYYKAKRENDGTEEKKEELKARSKDYKKSVMKAHALHRKRTIKKLRNAKTKDPKFYWSVINRQFNGPNSKNNNAISSIDFLMVLKRSQVQMIMVNSLMKIIEMKIIFIMKLQTKF